MRKAPGTNRLSLDLNLTNNFAVEIDNYIKALSRAVSGDPVLGTVMPMPSHNTGDILEKYITAGTNQLHQAGVNKQRGKSIAKYTLEQILEEKLQQVSF